MNYFLTDTCFKRSALFVLIFMFVQVVAAQKICLERSDKVPVNSTTILVCDGQQFSLTAKSCTSSSKIIYTYWRYLNDPFSPTSKAAKIHIIDTGSYEIKIGLAGLVLTDTFHVNYYPKPPFEIITSPNIPLKCEGVPLTLYSTKSPMLSNYKWYTVSDTNTLSRSDTIYDVKIETIYIVKARDLNKCPVSDTFEVFSSPFVPKVDLGSKDTTACEGISIQLNNKYPTNNGEEYKWSTGAITDNIKVRTSGKIWVRITNTLNCSATDTIRVVIVPAPVTKATPAFYSCPNAGVKVGVALEGNADLYNYEWKPNLFMNDNKLKNPTVKPPATQYYHVKVFSKAGCQDTTSILVIADPAVKASAAFSDTSVCKGKSLVLIGNGSSVPPSPSEQYTYQWSPATTLINANTNRPTASPQESTLYKLTITDTKGCADTTTVNVSVSQFSLSVSNYRETSCMGDSFQLKTVVSGGLKPYTYNWNVGSPFLSDKSIPDPWFKSGKEGFKDIALEVTDKAGCKGSQNIKLKTNALPALTGIPSSVSLCVGETKQLAFNSGTRTRYNYEWMPSADFISDQNSTTPSIIGTHSSVGSRIFRVRASDSSGCNRISESFTINTIQFASVNLGTTDTSTCIGNSVSFFDKNTFNKNLNFVWKDSLNNTLGTDSVFTTSQAGVFRLMVSSAGSGCTIEAKKLLKFTTPPTLATIVGKKEYCANEPVRLIAGSSDKNPAFTWIYNSGEGEVKKNSDTLNYYKKSNTNKNISFLLRTSNRCGSKDTTVKIAVHSFPVIKIISLSDTLYADSTAFFTTNNNIGSKVFWNLNDVLNTTYRDTAKVVLSAGKNKIFAKVTDENLCSSMDSLEIEILPVNMVKELFVPNIFSPLSSDINNQSLKIFGKNIAAEGFRFNVYNKWGEMVFSTEQLDKAQKDGWKVNLENGNDKLPLGVYTFTVTGKFKDGESFQKSGPVTLLK